MTLECKLMRLMKHWPYQYVITTFPSPGVVALCAEFWKIIPFMQINQEQYFHLSIFVFQLAVENGESTFI